MENVVPTHLQRLRAADIVHMAGLAAAAVGQEYYRSGAVHSMSRLGALLVRVVELAPKAGLAPAIVGQANEDTSSQMGERRFPVEVEFVGEGTAGAQVGNVGAQVGASPTPTVPSWRSKCACGSDTQGQAVPLLCTHGAALLYQWLAQPALFQTQGDSGEAPAGQGQAQPLRGSRGEQVGQAQSLRGSEWEQAGQAQPLRGSGWE